MIWVVNKLESIFYATVVLDWKNSLERNVFHITHTTCMRNTVPECKSVNSSCFFKFIERNSYWNCWRIPLLSAFLTKCRQEKFVSLYHRRHNIVPECKSVNSSIYWGRALAKAYLLKMEIWQIYTISLFFKNYEWSLTKIYDSTTLLY